MQNFQKESNFKGNENAKNESLKRMRERERVRVRRESGRF